MVCRTQGNTLPTISGLLERIQVRNSQMEEMHWERYGAGVGGRCGPSMLSLMSLSQPHMFTSPAALQTQCLGALWGCHCTAIGHWWLDSISSPSPSQEV